MYERDKGRKGERNDERTNKLKYWERNMGERREGDRGAK
jgi:hypothetical protein